MGNVTRDPVGGSLQRIVRQMRVPNSRFHLVVTKQFPDHCQAFPDQKTATSIQGENVLTVGRLLGHNDPGTTLKYTHLDGEKVVEAAEAVAAVLGRGAQ